MRMKSLLIVLVMAAFCPATAPAQTKPQAFDVKANYTKYEYSIPMRDGKKLFTSVYVPTAGGRTYPFLMVRTPYNVRPYVVDRHKRQLCPPEALDKASYTLVCQ